MNLTTEAGHRVVLVAEVAVEDVTEYVALRVDSVAKARTTS